MKFEWDPAKNERNIRDRGLSFERATEIDFETALVAENTRRDFGESRFELLATLDGRLHMLAFTPRGEALRIISFRKANRGEVRRYAKATESRTD